MASKNNATMKDLQLMISAGIDPMTGQPTRLACPAKLKENMKKLLRISDEQQAINRYTWYNLPTSLELSSEELERLLYYYGQLMFFYIPEIDKFFLLPYALDGEIDCYGRFKTVRPVPIGNSGEEEKTAMEIYIGSQKRDVLYDIKLDELTMDDLKTKCVLLSDFSKQRPQINISRQILNDPLIDLMADMLPFSRTALLNATGIQAMRVNTQDEYTNVQLASAAVDNAALSGQKYIPVVGQLDFQDLTPGAIAKGEEFMLAFQSYDNLRLSLYGLDNNGVFQKKAHMLQAEASLNGGATKLIYQDGLSNRQKFCDIVNSLTGLMIWCDPSEHVIGDINMDGLITDQDNQQIGSESNEGGEENV